MNLPGSSVPPPLHTHTPLPLSPSLQLHLAITHSRGTQQIQPPPPLSITLKTQAADWLSGCNHAYSLCSLFFFPFLRCPAAAHVSTREEDFQHVLKWSRHKNLISSFKPLEKIQRSNFKWVRIPQRKTPRQIYHSCLSDVNLLLRVL